jgi:hypothetical protein
VIGPCILIAYITSSGQSPLLDFLASLERSEPNCFAKWCYEQDLLQTHGTDIGMPHWKRLGGGLGEIRWRCGRTRLRIYCSEERDKRVVMYEGDKKKWMPFSNHDRDKCLSRQAEFRTQGYNQRQRLELYLSKQPGHARNQ